MSDYLSRLVARSFGTADVVRPRSASLFEPRDAAPQQLLADVDVETSEPLRASTHEPSALAEHPADTVIGRVSSDDPRPVPAPPVPGAPAVDEAAAPPRLPRADDTRAEPAAAAPALARPTPPLVVRVESREGRSERPAQERRPRRRRARSPDELSLLPSISPRPAQDEQPVVRVTIGRVEVRAVQSAPPAPPGPARDREPEAAPRQTLGDYLTKGARP